KSDSAPTTPASFRNVRFFMVKGCSVGHPRRNSESLHDSRKCQDCIPAVDSCLTFIFAELFSKPLRSYLQNGFTVRRFRFHRIYRSARAISGLDFSKTFEGESYGRSEWRLYRFGCGDSFVGHPYGGDVYLFSREETKDR